MENITSSAELKIAIQKLEIEQAENGRLLKEHFLITYQGIKSVSILKTFFKEIVSPSSLWEGLVENVISMASGYFSKKIIVGRSDNSLRKLIGNLLQLGVANVVAQNFQTIESAGKYLFYHFFSKKK